MSDLSQLRRRSILGGGTAMLVSPTFVLAQRAPTIELYKSPTCGCCGLWGDRMTSAGFRVVRHDVEALDAIKARARVPAELESCHTAFLDEYVLEGHVPVPAIRRLLSERPKARGLAVPDMPIGSPGMESGARREPYTVWLFADGEKARPFLNVT